MNIIDIMIRFLIAIGLFVFSISVLVLYIKQERGYHNSSKLLKLPEIKIYGTGNLLGCLVFIFSLIIAPFCFAILLLLSLFSEWIN